MTGVVAEFRARKTLNGAPDPVAASTGRRRLATEAFAAFSLIEVVVAVAVFAGAIIAILGLLGPSLETTREVLDSATAARLADSIDSELDRIADDPALGINWIRTASAGTNGIVMFATASGSRVVVNDAVGNDPVTGKPPGIAAGNRYFRIIIRQLSEPASDNEFLALGIRAEWPFNNPSGTQADLSERKWFSFNTAVRR